MKKFSLTLPDQINLLHMQNLLDKGCEAMPYHVDGESVRLWSRDGMQNILHEVDRHIAYHQVYYSLLPEWICRTGYPDFRGIGYGDALPDDLAESMVMVLAGDMKRYCLWYPQSFSFKESMIVPVQLPS